jgi:hypothetical protein
VLILECWFYSELGEPESGSLGVEETQTGSAKCSKVLQVFAQDSLVWALYAFRPKSAYRGISPQKRGKGGGRGVGFKREIRLKMGLLGNQTGRPV